MTDEKNGLLLLVLQLIAVIALIPTRGEAPPRQSGWEEHFNGPGLDTSRWVIANEQAPGYIPGTHLGVFQPGNVFISNGRLVLRLTQVSGTVDGVPGGVISQGGMIYTRSTYGFGTYEMRMRMSTVAPPSPDESEPGSFVSGNVSAGFTYDRNSQTEIDMEFAAHIVDPERLWLVVWRNKSPSSGPTPDDGSSTSVPMIGISTVYKTYKYIWKRGRVEFYVDGSPVATLTSDVPINKAHFMLTHWGTHNSLWGGTANIGTTRYFYVDRVKYTPL